MIHRIPNLADRFLYLNDDIFVGRPQRPEDYFDGDAPILRGTLRPLSGPVASLDRSPAGAGPARIRRRAEGGGPARGAPRELSPRGASAASDATRNAGCVLRGRSGPAPCAGGTPVPVGGAGVAGGADASSGDGPAGARVTPPIDVGYVRPGRPTGRALIETMDRFQRDAFASLCVQSLELMGPDDRAVILSALEARYG